MCNCNGPLKDVAFCSQCGALRTIDLNSPFQVFGLEETFFENGNLLKNLYLKIQNKLHPDRFPRAEEKRLAEQYSSYINRAYYLLKNPLKQAEFLLKEIQISLSSSDLIEQMEKREYLEKLTSTKEIEVFQKSVEKETEKTQKEMIKFFKEKERVKAAVCYGRLKYLSRLLEEIVLKKERL